VGEFPLFSDGVRAAVGHVSSMTTPSTANVLTAWQEITPSTAHDTSWVMIRGFSWGIAGQEATLDIGVGAAGSEKVLIPNLLFFRSQGLLTTAYMLPVAVPQGSRITARWRSQTTSAGLTFSIYLVGAGFVPSASFSTVRSWGNVANYGTTVDPGATANTLGVWEEMVASTEMDCRALCIGIGNAGNTTRLAARWDYLLLGVGAAGQEKVVIEIRNLCDANTGEDAPQPASIPIYPVNIPRGSRIAIRTQCTITDATDRLLRFMVYGLG
jgi:hypothetical protein